MDSFHRPPIGLTPELSKAARRELSLTQADVITKAGLQAYKLKQFEAGRFRPEIAFLAQLRDFYESRGVDFGQLEAYTAARTTQANNATQPRAGITPTPRPGFFISEHIAQELIDRVLDRLAENDDRIADLLQQAYAEGLFGGMTDETDARVRELFATMAESHLLFRFLQGKNIIAPIRGEPETIGHFLSQWLQESSPMHPVLHGVGSAEPGQVPHELAAPAESEA